MLVDCFSWWLELIDDIFEKNKTKQKRLNTFKYQRGKNCNGAIDGSKLKIQCKSGCKLCKVEHLY